MLVGELAVEEVAEVEVEEIVENVIIVGSSGIPAGIVVATDHMDMVVAVVVVVMVVVVEGEDQGQGLDHMNSVTGGGDLDLGLVVDLAHVVGPETDHIVTPAGTAEIALVIVVLSPRKKVNNVVHNPMIDRMGRIEIKGLHHAQGQDHLVKMAMNNIVIDTAILTVITK